MVLLTLNSFESKNTTTKTSGTAGENDVLNEKAESVIELASMNDEVNDRTCYGERSVLLVNSSPSVQDGYFLNKREFKDAVKLRYYWSFNDM